MTRKRHRQLASSSIVISAPTFGAPVLGIYEARKRQLDRDRQRRCRDRKATQPRGKKPNIHTISLTRRMEADLINSKLLSGELQIKQNDTFPKEGTPEYRRYMRDVIEDILKKVVELF